jgi:peptide/nickel transport system permease protein
MALMAFPSFFFGSIIIKIFAVELGWFETGGLSSNLPTNASDWTRFWDMAWHLVLPLFVLVVLNIGSMMRYTRTNTLEVLNADYIRTARAKGLSENTVVYKHVFRNTMIPLVTTLAGVLPGLFGGSMITETIFALPGIGNIAYTALREGDIPFIMGYNMFLAILTVVGVLLTDLMYAVVDPRVKLGK